MKYLVLFIIVFVIGGSAIYIINFRPVSYARVTNINSRGEAIIAFGDSITEGFGVDKEDAYPAVLSRELGVPVSNRGVSGDTSESGLSRLEKDVFPQNPRVVILFLGGNDFLSKVPAARLRENLSRVIERIHERGAMVVLVGIKTGVTTEDYSFTYKELSETYKTAYVPNVLSGIFTDESLMIDAIHPNKEGHVRIAQKILKVLVPLLKEADGHRNQ